MSLLWIDGFDSYAASGYVDTIAKQEGYAAITSQVKASNITRTGQGYSLEIDSGFNGLVKQLDADQSQLVVGFAWMTDSIVSNTKMVKFAYSGNLHFAVGVNLSGQLLLWQNTNPTVETWTVVASTGYNKIYANVWYHIEVKITASGTSGAVTLHVNGTSMLTYSGSTLTSGAGGPWANAYNQVHLSQGISYLFGIPNPSAYYDDYYILAVDGVGLHDFLGDQVVVTLFPATDASPNAQAATGGSGTHASTQADLSDASYLTASATSQQEMFGVSTLPASVVGVTAGQVHARAQVDSTAALPQEVLYAKGSTTTVSKAAFLTTSYTGFDYVLEQNPDGVAWTPTNAQAVKIGIGSA
jgi:hypothetical protein